MKYGTGGSTMSDANRLFFLRIALIVIGLTFIFGIYTLGVVWPSGWVWGQGHSHYLMMIIGVYATLGVFLLVASRDPYAHKSLIWFTIWSSVVHGAIMGVQAFSDSAERGHLIGDVPALLLVAIILAVLMPRTEKALASQLNAHYSHRFRDRFRSGWQRLRRELSTAWRQRHWFQRFGADVGGQVSGAAQGDRAARRSDRDAVQPDNRGICRILPEPLQDRRCLLCSGGNRRTCPRWV